MSVSELLLALQAKKSPMQALLEGVTRGFGQGYAEAPARLNSMMDLEDRQAARERAIESDKLLRQKIAGAQEQKTQSDFNAVGGDTKAPTPGLKLDKVTVDPKTGLLKPEFALNEKKPGGYQAKDYVDEKGVIRIGRFDPDSGKLLQSPDDAKSPHLDLGEKQDQFYQKEFDKLVEKHDPNVAGSRSVIGMLGRTNLNANRALVTIAKPVVTNQEAGNVMADIAQIYQGGAATNFGMSHQAYSTVYGKLQNAIQSLTGNPQDAVPDPIKKRLIEVLKDMKTTNLGIIKSSFDATEAAQKRTLSRFPNEWKAFRQNVEGQVGVGDEPAAAPATGAAVTADRYSDPAKAEAIRAQYKAGKLTKEAASAQLDALLPGK